MAIQEDVEVTGRLGCIERIDKVFEGECITLAAVICKVKMECCSKNPLRREVVGGAA